MDCFNQKFSHRFVYMAAPGGPAPAPHGPAAPPPPPPPVGAPAPGPAPAPPPPGADLESLLSRSGKLSYQAKARARQALLSEENAVYKEELVEKLIGGMPESEFLKELDTLEEEEESWGKITKSQREVRGKIRELHETAKSYQDILTPAEEKSRESERAVFGGHIRAIRALNGADFATDSSLRQMLEGATEQTHNGNPVLSHSQAADIYTLNPKNGDFESRFKNLTNGLKNVNGGPNFIKRLHALKLEELRIEQEFNRLYELVQRMVERNVSRAKREADKKRHLEIASRITGIHMVPGTVIRIEDSGILSLPPSVDTVRIKDVTFDEVPMRDHDGNILGYSLGIPRVHLDKGGKMTLARFKKWAEAQNATEVVTDVKDLEGKMGLRELGLNLKEGQELEYMQITGIDQTTKELKREPKKATIRSIRNGRVSFFNPVQYQVGVAVSPNKGAPTEDRDSLDYGEFLKWYLQNSVFLSLGMDELKKNLAGHNKNFNRTFGISPKDNPPIEVMKGEVLYYPDGSGRKFTITNVDKDKINMEGAYPMTFPQFFLWVRNNNVKKESVGGGKAPKPGALPPELANKKDDGKNKPPEHPEHVDMQEGGSAWESVKNFWYQTTFLSMNDMWSMGVSIKDFIKRRHERRSKERYSEVGKNLPGLLGTEFEKIKQSAENEEVEQFKSAMEHWSVERVKDVMFNTTNKDVSKACIMTLVHKGEMRWDDVRLWNMLNILVPKYTGRTDLHIALDKRVHRLKKPPTSGEDMTKAACDILWGDGGWHEWFSQNISAYNNAKKNFLFKAKQLEADPKGTGGLSGELKRLLQEWKEGKYVNPHEYEEYIDYAIDAGKMSAEDKIFYLIAGIVTRSPHGETLLHIDRVGEFDGQYLNKFPLLDFFTDKQSKKPVPPPNGSKREKRPWMLEDYEWWARSYFPDDFKNNEPGPQSTKFLWTSVLANDNMRTRLSKGLRKAEDMDHDDTQMFIPAATREEIVSVVLGSPTGGEKKNFTPEGYANGYPGFNQYLLSFSYAVDDPATDPEERKKLIQAIKESVIGYVLYDSVLMSRHKKREGAKLARLAAHHYERKPVVDNTFPRKHQTQLSNLVYTIGKAYHMSDEYLTKVLKATTGSMNVQSEVDKQQQIDAAIDQFGKMLDDAVDEDGGETLLNVIRGARERGQRDADSDDALRGMVKKPGAQEDFLNLMAGKTKPTVISDDALGKYPHVPGLHTDNGHH